MAAVAREHFVGAHAREQHLDAELSGALADEIGVDRRTVADRLIERAHHLRQHFRKIRADEDLVQIDVGPLRELPRITQIVRHCFELLIFGAEGDRKAIEPVNLLTGKHGDQT